MKLLTILMISAAAGMLSSCSKATQNGNPNPPVQKPLITLSTHLISGAPFVYGFAVTVQGDTNNFNYAWTYGDGTAEQGHASVMHQFPDNNSYRVGVTVSNKHGDTAMATADIDTHIQTITIDASTKYQTMDGFGGFGAQDVYWSEGPFTSARFVDDLINDLGLTILRDALPLDFEVTNDNADPNVTDFSKFNISNQTPNYHKPMSAHIQYIKDLKAAGLQKLIVSVWSPMTWMKTNNMLGSGAGQNAAPGYTPNPTAVNNQLRADMYEEFAEMCYAYVKVMKEQTGMDIYAFSIQNEPRFSQTYESCIYDGAAIRDLLKVVGRRFAKEQLTTKLFVPEDIGYLDGVSSMVKPILDDDSARNYASIIAVHGYALDGVTAASPDAQTWQTMYSWGAPYNKPLWMTETSGYSNDFEGAMAISRAMYTAINFGNVSAWLHWQLSQSTLDSYSLMASDGTKSKRYYASKNFYKYVRPGAVRIKATADESSHIYPLAFNSDTVQTIVLINDNKTASKAIKISGVSAGQPFQVFTTSAADNCKSYGNTDATSTIVLPAYSITTLYRHL